MAASRKLPLLLIGFAAGLLGLARPVVAETTTVNPAALYPEGPLWHAGALYYAEMTGERVVRWDGSENRTVWQSEGCGPTSLAPLAEGRFLVLCHLSAELVVLGADFETQMTIREDEDGRRLTSPNDVISDGKGGAYFSDAGVFWTGAPATGRVYHFSADGRLQVVAEGLRYANGVVLDRRAGRLFVSEHLARRVWQFDVTPSGGLARGRVFLDFANVTVPARVSDEHAGPDGLELDEAGNLYVCEYGAGRILVVGPDGQVRAIVQVLLPYVTNVALSPGKEELYVTAASTNRRRPYPGAVIRLSNPLK